jgi:branched-chain amino acid transport system permease protein
MATATVRATATATRQRGVAGTTLTAGLVGGVVAIYWPAVGMYERFEARAVIPGVGLGDILMVITALAVGFLGARRVSRLHEQGEAPGTGVTPITAGAGAAVISGAMLSLVLLFVDWFGIPHVRVMFTSFTPNLMNNLLTFGTGSIQGGAAVISGGFLLLGTAGALLQQAPQRIRRPVLVGFGTVLLASLAQPILTEVFRGLAREFGLNIPSRWLIARQGLALTGAVVVFAVALAVDYWRRRRAEVLPEAREARARRSEEARVGPWPRDRVIRVVLFVLLLLVLIYLPRVLGQFLSEVLGTVGVFVLMGLGLNIVVGYAGLLDLGYVAFFAVGAYSTAVLTSPRSFLGTGVGGEGLLNFWEALPFILILTMISGLMVGAPVLRLRGDYLAIVTLGFGEIARVVILSDWLRDYLGGAQGILGIPSPPFFGDINLRRPENLYYAILISCLVATFVAYRLKDSRVGRAWAAMREDESVAEAMGISVINYKLLAFVMGAAVSSFAGAFFAVKLGSVFAHSFDILVSINVLSIVVLGGMGSIPGVFVGALGLVGLPELLREFGEFRLLIYGGLLVILMILKPEGLLPEVRRKRELHQEELDEQQYERRVGADGTEPVIEAGPEDA